VSRPRRWLFRLISSTALLLGFWGLRSQLLLSDLPRELELRELAYPVRVGRVTTGSPSQLRFEIGAQPRDRAIEIETAAGMRTLLLRRKVGPLEFSTALVTGFLFFFVNMFVFLARMERPPARDFYWATMLFLLAIMTGGMQAPRGPPWSAAVLAMLWSGSIAFLPVLFIRVTMTFPRRRAFLDRHRGFVPSLVMFAAILAAWQSAAFLAYLHFRDAAAWQASRFPLLLGEILLVCLITAGFVVLVDSSRRLELTRERESTKWLLWGFTIGITPYVFLRTLPRLLGHEPPIGPAFDRILEIAIPISFAFAVVRYRFLDIDIIIRRSLLYTFLAGLMGGIYVFLAVLVGRFVRHLVPGAAPIIPFVSAVIPVALFNPTRRTIGSWIDRTFFKIGYNHAQALRSLKRQAPLASSPRELAGLVHAAMQDNLHPKAAAVVLPEDGELRVVGAVEPALARHAVRLLGPLIDGRDRPIAAPDSTSLPEAEEPAFPPELREPGLRIVMPLSTHGRALGWMLLAERDNERRYVEQDLAFVEAAAAEGAVALERILLVQSIAEEAFARQRLDEIDRLKSDFLSRVSHDLRTPITSISWSVQNLLDGVTGPLGERQREYLEGVRASSRQLARLVNNLVEISRLELSRGRVEIEPVKLADPVAEALEGLRPIALARGVRFQLDAPGGLGPVRGNRDKLIELVANLVENALHYSPGGAAIEISLARLDGGRQELRIRDHGPGIAPGEEELIFERYRQGRPSPCVQKSGFGLGLYVVREFLALMNGSVAAENHPAGGAVFACTFEEWREAEEPGT
jgi:signal transduction histidine kinase